MYSREGGVVKPTVPRRSVMCWVPSAREGIAGAKGRLPSPIWVLLVRGRGPGGSRPRCLGPRASVGPRPRACRLGFSGLRLLFSLASRFRVYRARLWLWPLWRFLHFGFAVSFTFRMRPRFTGQCEALCEIREGPDFGFTFRDHYKCHYILFTDLHIAFCARFVHNPET